MTESVPPPFPDRSVEVDSQSAGQTTDEGRGRIFPCPGCGADLTFNIGQQRMKCPYCSYEQDIELDDKPEIIEQDFHETLEWLRDLRSRQREADEPTDGDDLQEVRCESCGANVEFLGTLTSTECPYCASPIQLEDAHKATDDRIRVDGVLAFLVDREKAGTNLAAWVKSRWFAPNAFLKRGVDGKFNGVYLPYWTYDTLTANWYAGQRGEHYYVTVGSGDNRRRERRTRWYAASGSFQRFFDDVLVVATEGLPRKFVLALEPWPLYKCVPFNQEMIAGFASRTYEVELDAGFRDAKARIDAAIERDVRERIGGDEQRIHDIDTRYDAIAYKHLLLPLWLLAYRYHEQSYQVLVNAATGEVQGERPYSWVKIALAVLAALTVAGTIVFFATR